MLKHSKRAEPPKVILKYGLQTLKCQQEGAEPLSERRQKS